METFQRCLRKLQIFSIFMAGGAFSMDGDLKRIVLDESTSIKTGEMMAVGNEGKLRLEEISVDDSGAPLVEFVYLANGASQRFSYGPEKPEKLGPFQLTVSSVDAKAKTLRFQLSHQNFHLKTLLAFPDKTEEIYKNPALPFEKLLARLAKNEKKPFLIRQVYRNLVHLPISKKEVAHTEYFFFHPQKSQKALRLWEDRIDLLQHGADLPNPEELSFYSKL